DGSNLIFSILSNSNATLVTPTIDAADSTLDFSFGANENGTAEIVIQAQDSGGLTVTDTLVVTVNSVIDAPVVNTLSADLVGISTARLNGEVNPDNDPATVVFEYGLTASYGDSAIADQSPVNGSSLQRVSVNLSTLIPDTTYHFRVKATNSAGTSFGNDSTFTTQAANCAITVTNTNDSGIGSLRWALQSVCDGGTITFNIAGTGSPHIITLTSSSLTVGNNVTISGADTDGDSIKISGNNARRIFIVNPGVMATLENLSLINGNAGGFASGGAIQNAGDLTVNNVIFHSNTATADGGGIINTGGTLNVNNSSFINNHADYDGGGIRVNNGTVRINGSLFTGNSSGFSGAALRRVGGTLTVRNSTLSSNNAGMNGGGVEGTSTFINCTIFGNSAVSNGGGVYSGITLGNSIVYSNTAGSSGPNIQGSFTSLGYNLIGDVSGASGFTGTDITGSDPLLDPLADNGGSTLTHALQVGSPAIDAGTRSGALGHDQRGYLRIGAVDIGAYEVSGVLPDKVWTGEVNNLWSNPANWSPPGVPYLTDIIYVPGGHTVLINTGTVTVDKVYIDVENSGKIQTNTTNGAQLRTGGSTIPQ
ncbi:MAG: fibronectin type III domain-containing protein, partial [Gemmatimonadetes bacterium]